ncbi:MAG: aminopeptidase P family protein [Desulfobacteraceae bacterium]|nr:MAG: aminopeptidase P family protein [Desulfobacteraceae bacterium]
MKTDEKVKMLRSMMTQEGIHACIIPTADPHQSEYIAPHWQARQWLSGFSGSAGTAVVTLKTALLWTDSRYYIQAAAEIRESEFELMKQGQPKVPTISKWLLDHLNTGDVVGIDGQMFSHDFVKTLKTDLEAKPVILDPGIDLLDRIWMDRPELPGSEAFELKSVYAGQTREHKLEKIREKLRDNHANLCIMTALDEIAWTFNLRGSDIPFSPVNIAYAMIDLDRATLFIDPAKLPATVSQSLEKEGITLKGYTDFKDSFHQARETDIALAHSKHTNHQIYSIAKERCRIIDKPSPAGELKAVKSQDEMTHIRNTMVKDGLAVTRFLHWVETRFRDESITELSAGDKMLELRQQQPQFIENSFSPIMAFQEHSPICHYSADKTSDKPIKGTGMFLTDSGGNYLTGTTDITRTIHLGPPPEDAVRDYTLVLKGHIAVARAMFPKGTKGFQIDTLARHPMWERGINFGHGTGHGVGFFLNVHEGPASISPNPIDKELKPGMVLTNEPGIYREGQYGIRIENMILVQEDMETEFGRFLSFENLTLCHYETALVDRTLLTEDEIRWINTYHERVYERLSPQLETEVQDWLKEKTAPI